MKRTKAHQRYKLSDGKTIVPGVTTITRQLGWNTDVLVAWARREALKGNDPDKMRDDAADAGTCAHYLIECHIKRKTPDLSDFTGNQIEKAEKAYGAYLQWESETGIKPLKSEPKLVHETLRYGGTIDLICKKNGELWLVDFKTSSNIYPEHIIQVAAYGELWRECKREKINQHHILHLSKDGSFTPHLISTNKISLGWQAFTNCLELYHIQKVWGK